MSVMDESDSEDLLNQKENTLPTVLSSISKGCELNELLENLTAVTKFLPVCNIMDVEDDIFRYVMSPLRDALVEIYTRNKTDNALVNLELAVKLLEILDDFLEYLIQFEEIEGSQVQSALTNLPRIIHSSFEHVKFSQNLELFKKTEEAHSKFLEWLNKLIFNLMEENDVTLLKNVLEVLCEISGVLSGMKVKLMVSNWKAYIGLAEKYSELLGLNFDSSLPIRYLTEEINNNFDIIIEIGPNSLNNILQYVKLNGFLIKVALKLFDAYWSCLENCYEEIFSFCLLIFSFPIGYFQYYDFPDSFRDTLLNSILLILVSFISRISNEFDFLQFIYTKTIGDIKPERRLGFLYLSNEVLKCLPDNSANCINAEFLHLVFACLKNCYQEYFWCDLNFYEEFTTNFAIIPLVFPQIYCSVETLLIQGVLQENIWVALISIDVWCLILRNSSVSTIIETLNGLLLICGHLQLGLFTFKPEIVFLINLIQRIFNLLPVGSKNNFLSKFGRDDLTLLKIINDIPKNQSFISQLLNEFLQKIKSCKGELCLNDVKFLIDNFEIMPNYPKLPIEIVDLWSFNVSDSLVKNGFFKIFVEKLGIATNSIVNLLNGEQILLILNQLKECIIKETIFKLILCDFLSAFSRINIDFVREKSAIIAKIECLLQILLKDQNVVVQQTIFEVVKLLENYEFRLNSEQIHKFHETSNVVPSKNYLELLGNSTFQHNCIEWSDYCDLPQSKKIKIDIVNNLIENNESCDDVGELIHGLKMEIKRLGKMLKGNRLSAKQAGNIKGIIGNLESFL